MTNKELCISDSNDALELLVERARTLMENARSSVTRAGYARDVADYEVFCQTHGLNPMPPSAPVVALYLAELSTRLRPATIARRLAAIADATKRAGFGTEALRSFAVQETWKGIRRTLGIAPEVKSPLTASAIRAMVRACPDSLLGSRDRALLLVGYGGGFRRSELAAIELRHLTFEPDSVSIPDSVTIYIPRSKTDQESEGRTVTLTRGSTEESCPVTAIRNWVSASGLREGSLLRSVDRHGRVGGGLNPDSIARILKRAAARANLAIDLSEIAGHSLRSGLVTEASQQGMSPLAVMEVTGHRTIAVVKRYFRGQLAGGPSAAGAGL
ncbi:MAG: site-specific integrase [Acidobacteriota bacterium]